jgi:hypothetical protein
MPGEFNGPVVGTIHENGEITPAKVRTPQRRAYADEEVMYMQIPVHALAEYLSALSPTQMKIIDVVLADYREGQPWARMTATEIATEAGLTSKNFYRAIAPLRKAGILLRSSSTMWQINPHVGWRGSRKVWADARRITPKPNMEELR